MRPDGTPGKPGFCEAKMRAQESSFNFEIDSDFYAFIPKFSNTLLRSIVEFFFFLYSQVSKKIQEGTVWEFGGKFFLHVQTRSLKGGPTFLMSRKTGMAIFF
jgi:hypothetical protein